jgi:hypothetical protein
MARVNDVCERLMERLSAIEARQREMDETLRQAADAFRIMNTAIADIGKSAGGVAGAVSRMGDRYSSLVSRVDALEAKP